MSFTRTFSLQVHELVACALRMETNPSAKQRKRRDLSECIERTLALAAKLVREERLALRHARGGERVRLYLEAFTRRQVSKRRFGKDGKMKKLDRIKRCTRNVKTGPTRAPSFRT